MDDIRMHPNPLNKEELESAGLGPGRLIEAAAEFKRILELATGFDVATYESPKYQPTTLSVVLRERGPKFGGNVAQFSLNLFPGNQDIVVSTSAYVYEARRGFGLGRLLHQMRLDVTKKVGFQMIFATVAKDNAKERTILSLNHWSEGLPTTETALFFWKRL